MDFSPEWLFASICVSCVGFAFFRYGKQQGRGPQLTAGLALMVYPSFVASPLWMLSLGGGLLFALWCALRAGL